MKLKLLLFALSLFAVLFFSPQSASADVKLCSSSADCGANAACSSGSCICDGQWYNCDANFGNGCEHHYACENTCTPVFQRYCYSNNVWSTGQGSDCGMSDALYIKCGTSDCSGAFGYTCSPNPKCYQSGSSASCVECLSDSDCPASKPKCDTSSHTCYKPPCTGNSCTPCTAALTIGATGTGFCSVTASVSAGGCNGKSFQVKDSAGSVKCSGTIGSDSFTYNCPSSGFGTISGSQSYSLYVDGGLKDSRNVDCGSGTVCNGNYNTCGSDSRCAWCFSLNKCQDKALSCPLVGSSPCSEKAKSDCVKECAWCESGSKCVQGSDYLSQCDSCYKTTTYTRGAYSTYCRDRCRSSDPYGAMPSWYNPNRYLSGWCNPSVSGAGGCTWSGDYYGNGDCQCIGLVPNSGGSINGVRDCSECGVDCGGTASVTSDETSEKLGEAMWTSGVNYCRPTASPFGFGGWPRYYDTLSCCKAAYPATNDYKQLRSESGTYRTYTYYGCYYKSESTGSEGASVYGGSKVLPYPPAAYGTVACGDGIRGPATLGNTFLVCNGECNRISKYCNTGDACARNAFEYCSMGNDEGTTSYSQCPLGTESCPGPDTTLPSRGGTCYKSNWQEDVGYTDYAGKCCPASNPYYNAYDGYCYQRYGPQCSDGIDNDRDCLADCADPDCSQQASCAGTSPKQSCGGPCGSCTGGDTCNNGVCGPSAPIWVPPVPTCSDGIQNQGEAGVDCGGPCPACDQPPACTIGIWPASPTTDDTVGIMSYAGDNEGLAGMEILLGTGPSDMQKVASCPAFGARSYSCQYGAKLGAGTYVAAARVSDTKGQPCYKEGSFSVTQAFDFSVSVEPASGTVKQGEGSTAIVKATLLKGNPKTVNLAVVDFINSANTASCSLDPQSLTLSTMGAKSALTCYTTLNTLSGVHPIIVSGKAENIQKAGLYSLSVVPGCMGNAALTLSPRSVPGDTFFTAIISGLSGCDGTTAYFSRQDQPLSILGRCTIKGSGCSALLTAPSKEGIYTYMVAADKNKNGYRMDPGEYGTADLQVQGCKAIKNGDYCTGSYGYKEDRCGCQIYECK